MQVALQLCTRHHICRDRCDRRLGNFFVFFLQQTTQIMNKIYKRSHTFQNSFANCAISGQIYTYCVKVFVLLLPKVCMYWLNLHILRKYLCHFYASVNVGQIYIYCVSLCAFQRIYAILSPIRFCRDLRFFFCVLLWFKIVVP